MDTDPRALLPSYDAVQFPSGAGRQGPAPRPLGLDKMFSRALHWRQRGPSAPLRPPSPPPGEAHLTLPTPFVGGDVSPLAQLFTYQDLVPEVLKHLRRPRELAAAARVCKEWAMLARRSLYKDIWVRPWEDAPKRKYMSSPYIQLMRLFETLSTHPELCETVRSLDIRFFPLDLQGESRSLLEDMILVSLERMRSLTRLVWTRDRSLSSELFTVITSLPALEHLELSGHSTRLFDPSLLGSMPALRDLRVMMPDTTFRAVLPGISEQLDRRTNGGLWGLALVCRSFNFINDDLLRELAPHLTALRRLQLIGHTKVTKEGVYAVVAAAPNLEELVLDAPPHSDLVDLTDAPRMPSLQTFSLSFAGPAKRVALDASDMPVMRRTDTLRALELNITTSGQTGGQRQRYLPLSALDHLQAQFDFASLTRLALLNLVIDQPTLSYILTSAPGLEELYICVSAAKTLHSCPELGKARLRIFHANAPEVTGPTRADLTQLAAIMGRVQQIGSLNRVYEVQRYYEGEKRVVELNRWSQITTPGYFQVWRP